MMKRIIFHVDVNNAYLSWTAVHKLEMGEKIDIRTIPSVIGGDEKSRHGIVLAKSPVAKKMGIVTAEPIYMARKKCPNLKVYPVEFSYYGMMSNKMYEYLSTYTPIIERYSIDECFMDLTGTSLLYKDYLELAHKIKDDIKNKFGFTVNVGIGNNRLCAKMASDFEKPDKVHTLYEDEIKTKMWPLDVGDLFMVGKKTAAVLKNINIKTIGDLANASDTLLKRYFKNQAEFLKKSAWGIDDSIIAPRASSCESISISETLQKDCSDEDKLKDILFRQTEEVTRNLRWQKDYAKTIAVTFKNSDFVSYSHQKKLLVPKNATIDIYKDVVEIFDSGWKKDPIRNIGVRLSNLTKTRTSQTSLFEEEVYKESNDLVEETIDKINNKYGRASVIPASIKIIGKSHKHEKPKQ